jgi:hypothetical protein
VVSRKTNLAQENVSKLASIGVAAMEMETYRRLYNERKRRHLEIEKLEGYGSEEAKAALSVRKASAADLKVARQRLQGMIGHYRDWLDEVNA